MKKKIENIVERFGLECPLSDNCKNDGILSEHDSPCGCYENTGGSCPVPVQCEFCYTEEKSKMNLRDVINSLLQEDKWTSVEDELPKKAGKYIVCHKKGIIPRVEETEITKSLIPLLKYTSITHWQPLPEKPKED